MLGYKPERQRNPVHTGSSSKARAPGVGEVGVMRQAPDRKIQPVDGGVERGQALLHEEESQGSPGGDDLLRE